MKFLEFVAESPTTCRQDIGTDYSTLYASASADARAVVLHRHAQGRSARSIPSLEASPELREGDTQTPTRATRSCTPSRLSRVNFVHRRAQASMFQVHDSLLIYE